MDPTVNTGSFGAAIGGLSPELQAAVQSRQQGGSGIPASNQVSQTAPTADMAPQMPNMPSMGGGSPMPQAGGSPMGSATGSTPMPFDSQDLKMILGSFNNIIKKATKGT